MFRTSFFAAVSALLSIASFPATAASDPGWMTGYSAYKALVTMENKGYMPVSIKCRDSNKRGLDVGETEYKVGYARRTNNIPYFWAVGSDYGMFDRKAKTEGYTKISFDQYKREKSGLVIRCAIWQKR